MNLNQYLTANTTATLADAKLIFDTRNIQDNEIVNFDAQFGISEIMLTIINDPAVTAQLMKEARIFNAIVANGRLSADAQGVNVFDPTTQYALNEFVVDGRFTQVMRDALENKVKSFPFANTTLAQFDAAKAEIALTGTKNSTNTTYNSDASIGYIIKLQSEELIISVIHDLPVTVQTTIQLWAENLDTVSGLYIRETQPLRTLQFETTSQAKSYRERKNFGARKTRIIGISDKLQSFVIDVQVA